MSRKYRVRVASAACSALAAVIVSYSPAQGAAGQAPQKVNPYSPAAGHPYRHGVVPTRQAWQKMKQWDAVHPAISANTLAFGGGIDGIGVTSGTPRVYLVFWGSQWTSGGDPNGAASYLQNLFAGIGTGGELWSGAMTQYCDGASVPNGATACPSGAPLVGYPSSGALAGVWFDTSAPAPAGATAAQLAAEAVAAAAHFGNTSAASNRYVQYIVASPSGTNPDGFRSGGFCAWHNYTSSAYGDIAYTNMPYVTDVGANCGENFVNSGSAGILDGFSIVAGHEYAETLTDESPFGGWSNPSNHAEDGDECAWIAPGNPGGAADVSMGNGAYAMQSTWSNDTNACAISHTVLTASLGTPQFIDAVVESCNGAYRVTWSAVANATSYEISVSYPPYIGYQLLKTVAGTGSTLRAENAPNPTYFEVQACDGSGCSLPSDPLGLAYYSGCP